MRFMIALLFVVLLVMDSPAQLHLRHDVQIPQLPAFQPLPAENEDFSAQITALVEECKLDEICPAARNPDGFDEYSSICVVDLSDLDHPVVGGWKMNNFVYPASTYKIYVVAEAIRQSLAGEFSLDDKVTIKEHNVREDDHLTAGQELTIAELLRLICAYSDNTAANEAIDLVDRQRASALLRSMGLLGSDITRKYLPRNREDPGYADVPGTNSSAFHFATFFYAVETGAIGGGKGRGLIKGLMSNIQTDSTRLRAGLPDSATIYTKTGEWNTFTCEAGIVEDGKVRYIICVLAPFPIEDGAPRIAEFGKLVHTMMKDRAGVK